MMVREEDLPSEILEMPEPLAALTRLERAVTAYANLNSDRYMGADVIQAVLDARAAIKRVALVENLVMSTMMVEMPVFEFERYHATEEGEVSLVPVYRQMRPFPTEKAAIAYAKVLVRRHQGPVDIFRAGDEPHQERAVGTVVPKYPYSESKLTEFERA